ncbi:uncharacterized protein LY79DRAFT_370203 [Colletotrichum navitas]|uniref:Uncharacterized protein n=1 Tax=Colletotrichum navitas TaxID=681940 RepID=A0AAD8PQT1_9PEZI|nr:uncharacterized protein LY79DRAFT_370203 [Colletotrichum navitas]KAK1574221.1 hypothetical protein LY79DRAFT_370203 [Colletotrichum navitas]
MPFWSSTEAAHYSRDSCRSSRQDGLPVVPPTSLFTALNALQSRSDTKKTTVPRLNTLPCSSPRLGIKAWSLLHPSSPWFTGRCGAATATLPKCNWLLTIFSQGPLARGVDGLLISSNDIGLSRQGKPLALITVRQRRRTIHLTHAHTHTHTHSQNPPVRPFAKPCNDSLGSGGAKERSLNFQGCPPSLEPVTLCPATKPSSNPLISIDQMLQCALDDTFAYLGHVGAARTG